MKTRAMRQAAGALLALAISMPAVQAQDNPTIEVCAQYAEADVVFDGAEAAAKAAMTEGRAAESAVVEKHRAALEEAKRIYEEPYLNGSGEGRTEAEDEAALSRYDAAREAADAAYKADIPEVRAARIEAESAYQPAIEEAQAVLTQTYLAIYAESGGMKSDVWEVMVKLINNQRGRCWQLYGL